MDHEARVFPVSKLIKAFLALLVLILLSLATYFFLQNRLGLKSDIQLPFQNGLGNQKIDFDSLVDGYSMTLENEKLLRTILSDRNFFKDGILLPNATENSQVNSIKISLSPQEQSNLVTNWNYPDGDKVGISTGFEYADGDLTIKIYLKSDGLQLDSAEKIINAQLISSVMFLTRKIKVQTVEDTDQITNSYIDQMGDNYLLKLSKP